VPRSFLVAALLALGLGALAGTETRAEIVTVMNVPYLEDARYPDDKDKLDIYRPDDAERAPVFVFIHGGGLLNGDKSGQSHVGRFFADHGFVTVCINTRLSPSVRHPAHVEDAAAAIGWVARNIASQGGDPRRIAVGGHSAGAYLAALVALDPRFLEAVGLDRGIVRALVPISGFFWVERLAPSRPKTVWGDDEETWREASPSRYVDADAPPSLILWADGDADDRRQEGKDLAAAYRAAGAGTPATAEIPGRDHVSIWSSIGEADDPTGPRVVAFLRQVLGD